MVKQPLTRSLGGDGGVCAKPDTRFRYFHKTTAGCRAEASPEPRGLN